MNVEHDLFLAAFVAVVTFLVYADRRAAVEEKDGDT